MKERKTFPVLPFWLHLPPFLQILLILQLNPSSFLWIIQEHLLLVLDIPEIHLCSCKRLNFLFFFLNLIAYFFHNCLHIPSLFFSTVLKFFLYYLYLCSICLSDHNNCRIFLSFFFFSYITQILYDHPNQQL